MNCDNKIDNKFLGPNPYDENGIFKFMGREDETISLFERIVRNDYTVYYAASGEGKSSLLKAGLFPILRRRYFFPVYIVFKETDFCNNDIASVVFEKIDNACSEASGKYGIEYKYEQSDRPACYYKELKPEQISVLTDSAWWKFRNYCFKQGDKEIKPLFVFDQFEEVFTKVDYEWTKRFFSWLEEISTDYVPESLRKQSETWDIDIPTQKNFKALFSLRTEYLGELDYWCVQQFFLPSLQENRMCLKPLTPKGAKEVINLDESSLGEYADAIIDGCSVKNANTGDDNEPCVYAMILSIVCYTLSSIKDNKARNELLEKVKEKQEETINDILLRFYKEKLKEAGIDYNRDETIINAIEDAFVDKDGKRSRHDTNEDIILPLKERIEKLIDCGLLKKIGRKEIGKETIYTVEIPHDRLCMAINSSRKERYKKLEWKLKRQKEWIQFGLITAVVVGIIILWRAMLPVLKPVMHVGIAKEFNIGEEFKSYLIGETPKFDDMPLDEGFSTILLMVLSLLILPFVTVFFVRKGKKWYLSTIITSSVGFICFLLLIIRNSNVYFSSDYVSVITWCCTGICLIITLLSMWRITRTQKRSAVPKSKDINLLWWPLWGGYFIFACYVFWECLSNTTFGVSVPGDSCWALFVLPVLFAAWTWSFLNLNSNSKKKLICSMTIVSVLSLALLSIISYVPSYNDYKLVYGFGVSILLMVFYIVVFAYVIWHSESCSPYYSLSKMKRGLALVGNALVLIVSFVLNLGYNPIAITPNSICHVASWRDVLVFEKDSMGNKKMGVLYSINGDTIIPCCIPMSNEQNDSLLKGKYPIENGRFIIKVPFASSPFYTDSIMANTDNTLVWHAFNKIITAGIPIVSTLEEYLYNTMKGKMDSRVDSINFYAARLFCEMRNANINYLISGGKKYDLKDLPSLTKLEALQQKALKEEIRHFVYIDNNGEKTDTIFPVDSLFSPPQKKIEVLEDDDLIDFHKELSRSFILYMLNDRVNMGDMPAVFTLENMYLLCFFDNIPAMKITSSMNSDMGTFKISSEDIFNKRPFAWYDVFNSLCIMDVWFNTKRFAIDAETGINRAIELLNREHLSNYETTDDIIAAMPYIMDLLTNSQKVKERNEKLKAFLDFKFPEDYNKTNSALQHMKEDVLNTLLIIMNKYPYGIYNNDFENVCQMLIMVSENRGDDVKNDTIRFADYLSAKKEYYGRVRKQINQIKKEKMYAIKEIDNATLNNRRRVNDKPKKK